MISFFQPRTKKVIEEVIARKLTYLEPQALEDLVEAVDMVEKEKVPGDFLEMGCALGGSAIVIGAAKKQAISGL